MVPHNALLEEEANEEGQLSQMRPFEYVQVSTIL